MIRVWDISPIKQQWPADDVVTKCYIIPRSENQRSLNPLPDRVRDAKDLEERKKRFAEIFETTDDVSWDIVPLILPPEDTIKVMVRDDDY